GFRKAMREHRLRVRAEWVMLGEYSREFGREAMQRLLDAPRRATALLACSDYIAVGVLQAVRQRGLSVPADLSLVGFDDMPFAEMVDPPLTTVRQPIAEMGRIAFERLLALLNQAEAPALTRLPVELVVRRSVAKLPNGRT